MLKKIDKKQVIFAIIYILIALFIALFIKKADYNNYMLKFGEGDIRFEESDGNVVSEYFTFPKSAQKITLSYRADHDVDLVIVGDNIELLHETLPAAEVNVVQYLYFLEQDVETYYISFRGITEEELSVYNFELLSDEFFNNDALLAAIISFIVNMLILAFILCVKNNKIKNHQIVPFVLLSFFTLFVSSPCFFNYVQNGHDIWCHLGRIEGIMASIIEGQRIAMIIPDTFNGYGILSFAYPQFFLYLPALLRLAGVSMPSAYHVFLLMVNIGTTLACYFSVKSVLKNICPNVSIDKIVNSATVATIFYLCMSYRLEDVYVRGANGEMLAMIFFPLVIAGTYHCLAGNRKDWLMLPLGLTGILQSHILSCCMVIVIIVAVLIPFVSKIIKDNRWKEIVYSIGVFFVLNLWYIVPFIRFYGLPLNTDNLVNHYVYKDVAFLGDLFTANPNTTFEDHQYFLKTIGVASLIACCVVVIYMVYKLKEADRFKDNGYLLFLSMFGCFVVSLLFSSDLLPLEYIEENYKGIWSGIEILQFPYRLISIVSVSLVFMLAIALVNSSASDIVGKYVIPVCCLIVAMSVYDSSTVIEGYKHAAAPVAYPYTGNYIQHLPGDYLPANTSLEGLEDTEPHIENGVINDYQKSGTVITMSVSADEGAVATVPLLYYPCYKVRDELGNRVNIYKADNNRIGIELPTGEHTITMYAKYMFLW